MSVSSNSSTIRVSQIDHYTNDTSSSTTNTIRFQQVSRSLRASSGPQGSGQQACNESKRHDNDEKALFHGMKSAYRMSREYDGEYGTDEPQYCAAARIAANVARAYLQATDQAYTREASQSYVREEFGPDTKLGEFGETGLEDAIDKAWTQIDSKEHHYDGARTALAAAEMFLQETLDVGGAC